MALNSDTLEALAESQVPRYEPETPFLETYVFEDEVAASCAAKAGDVPVVDDLHGLSRDIDADQVVAWVVSGSLELRQPHDPAG